jgi:hypothetical protein
VVGATDREGAGKAERVGAAVGAGVTATIKVT